MKCLAFCVGFFAAISVIQAAGDADFMVPREYDSNPVDNNLNRRGGEAKPKPSGKPKVPNWGQEKGGKGWGGWGYQQNKGDKDCDDDDKKEYSYRYTKGKSWWKRGSGAEEADLEKRDLKEEQFVLNEAEDATVKHPVYSKTVVVLVPTYTRHILGPTKIKDGTDTLTFAAPTVFTFTKGPYTRTKQVLSCHTTTTEYDIEEGCADCNGWPYATRK